MVRWSIYLQQYSIIVQHCRGRDNIIANFFSRNHEGKLKPENNPHRFQISSLTRDLDFVVAKGQIQPSIIYRLTRKYDELPSDIRRDLDRIGELQQGDSHIAKIISRVKEGQESDHYQGLQWHNIPLPESSTF